MGRLQRRGARSWLKRFVFAVPAVAAVALALSPGLAGAWISWDGADPVIDLGHGHKLAITVNMQRRLGCFLDKPIDVNVKLPKGYNNARVVSESSYTWVCDPYPANTITTKTKLTSGGNADGASIRVNLQNRQDYPWSIDVCYDRDLVGHFDGSSNAPIAGEVPLKATGTPCPAPAVPPPGPPVGPPPANHQHGHHHNDDGDD